MANTDLLMNLNSRSMFAESIKSIRTNLQFSAIDSELKTILITSPEAGNGKSFIAANLAEAYAQEGKKVLLIDCDLRRGRQHTIFELPNPQDGGYSNLILNYKEEIKLSRYVLKTSDKNIDLIPSGPTPPNPTELLSSRNNYGVINSLKTHYDIIILDCAPVLGINDTQMLLKYSDANLVIVTSGETSFEVLERTKRQFEQLGSKIDGVVINKANVKGSSYYYYTNEYYTSTTKTDKVERVEKK